MVATAKIDPLYFGSEITKMLLYGNKSCLQIIGILLTECMEMKTIK